MFIMINEFEWVMVIRNGFQTNEIKINGYNNNNSHIIFK